MYQNYKREKPQVSEVQERNTPCFNRSKGEKRPMFLYKYRRETPQVSIEVQERNAPCFNRSTGEKHSMFQ